MNELKERKKREQAQDQKEVLGKAPFMRKAELRCYTVQYN